MSMYLEPDYRDMLCALIDRNVVFLVVGAHALAAHGYPRATGDFDIWIACSPKKDLLDADAPESRNDKR